MSLSFFLLSQSWIFWAANQSPTPKIKSVCNKRHRGEERRGEELQIPWIKTSPSIPWILTNWTTTIKNPLPQLPTLLLLLLKLSDNQNGIPGMIKFWSSNRGYVSIWHLVQVTKSSTSFHFLLSALCLCYQSWFMFLLTFFFLNEISVCFMCLSLIKRIDLIWPLNTTKNNHQHFVHKKCWNDKRIYWRWSFQSTRSC